MTAILIANRGEIAIRIAQACAELGLESVALHSADEAGALHVRRADRAAALPGEGARAYLDVEAVAAAAREAGCAAVHPGYGFLSENAAFARAVAAAGMTFVGPDPEVLERLGDKTGALALAREVGAPVNPGLPPGADADEIRNFMTEIGGPVVIKAVSGGGGRGMRVVRDPTEIEGLLAEARAEAEAAFGSGAVYAERFMPRARHVEVQIVGDGREVAHLWERDCTLQRRHQKLVEIAPAPELDPAVRDGLLEASVAMAGAVGYRGLGTFEFLVGDDGASAFIEANPRLQVEHTVTEAVTGVDLVQAQIRIALGASLADLGLRQADVPAPRGAAVQLRVNMERMGPDGAAMPASGTLNVYEPPGGPGVRVDGHGWTGMRASADYDGLLAKLICHSPDGAAAALGRARRALRGFRIEGVETNLAWLHALLEMPETGTAAAFTTLIETRAEALHAAAAEAAALWPRPEAPKDDARAAAPLEEGAVAAPMLGTILEVRAAPGDAVAKGAPLFVMEAMKMQHVLRAEAAGEVRRVAVAPGDRVREGDLLAVVAPGGGAEAEAAEIAPVDLDRIRPDLAELLDRRALTRDEARPEAVAKRRALGKSTARENVARLCDDGSFVEYGDLAVAAQRGRRSLDDLMRSTPADGLVTGFGRINGDLFPPEAARCAVMAYDYTVLAGTQGMMNHIKTDRMLGVIERQGTPLVFFCEGGGGRPGDVDLENLKVAWLDITTFHSHARLSGKVPMVGIASGRLFAGNAALLGCCDVTIATRDACIGMGGPAMIEGGGLGVYRPEEVGPTSVQWPSGVIDVLVEDETEAVDAAKRYLSYFQGRVGDWSAPDPRALRHVVPENRLEVYDVHAAIEGLADADSVMELRAGFAPGMVTALVRVEGRPMGVLANNPMHLAGAIDSNCADKAARFLQLCNAHGLPLLTLIDTPGMMVGPDVEATALVRHCSRLFLNGAAFEAPLMSVILRKGYGLGAQAMAGGSFRAPLFVAAWPTGEIGAMGLEGSVRLGFRRELEAEADPEARERLFRRLVDDAYARGKAMNAASLLEFDNVIDPADTRSWIVAALEAAPTPARGGRGFVDAW